MIKFIELPIVEQEETKKELISVANIGRVFQNPQNSRLTMVELNYHSINDAPVCLEVDMPYETLRTYLLPNG